MASGVPWRASVKPPQVTTGTGTGTGVQPEPEAGPQATTGTGTGIGVQPQPGAAPEVTLRLDPGPGVEHLSGPLEQCLGHLAGWGSAQVGAARHPVYPGIGDGAQFGKARWTLHGAGPVRVHWEAGRGGAGTLIYGVASSSLDTPSG